MPDVSPIQLIIVLIIALVVLGPKRLPEVGRSLGKGIREFKDSVSGNDKDEEPPPPAASIEPAPPSYTATTTEQGPVHHTGE
jgi:sec-independent protein translocase protein TatA